MTELERRQKLEAFGNTYFVICEALGCYPREMWHYKSAPDQWSIHEIIAHIADSEANGYIRFRKAIAEPGATITAYDQDKWTETLNYPRQNADHMLELFRWLRATSYNLLRLMPETAWQNSIVHPERGAMTLEMLLELNTGHVEKHLEQIHRVYKQWKAARQQR